MSLKDKINRLVASLRKVDSIYEHFQNDYKSPKMLLGKLLANNNRHLKSINSLEEVEFQVFSQWGDDGIIQHLINQIDFPHKTFIEFGVETYKESNTRFLTLNNNWSGLVMDGSRENVEFIKRDTISWTHELFAEQAFITRENINELVDKAFLRRGYDKEVGIFSIDIDGNDFYVWEALTVVNPIVFIVEYNFAFGTERAVTIPYQKDFVMDRANNPFIWGASLKSFCWLAEQRGYGFIGCNSNGNNAYFVRKDKIENFRQLSCEEGYVRGKFRLTFDANGNATPPNEIHKSLSGKKVFNVISGKEEVL